MTGLEYTMPVIWALLIGTAVALYIVLDGFDLGLGILFPYFRSEQDRDQMMNSVAPFWDGNETWLVLGGGGLWVAFPQAYAVIMPALYLPVILMLLALIFRGVAFEFRWVAKPRHRKWDIAFAAGSTVAALSQGIILGGLIQGITVVDGQFAGGAFDWLTPFTLMCGLGVVAGYALLGATWLMMKTEGPVEVRARRMAPALLARAAAVRRGRQPLDAAHDRAHRRALVQPAEPLLPRAGAARHAAARLDLLARHAGRPHRACHSSRPSASSCSPTPGS